MKKKHLYIILFLITVSHLSACSSGDTREITRPTLSETSVTMEIGKPHIIKVYNAEKISASDPANLLHLEVNGNEILLTAHKAGTTSIRIDADNSALTCRVEITHPLNPDPGNDEWLNNHSTRFESKKLTMNYSTPGTVVSCSDNIFEFISLTNGDKIISTPNSLTVNDKILSTTNRKTVKHEGNTLWLTHTADSDSETIKIVINDL